MLVTCHHLYVTEGISLGQQVATAFFVHKENIENFEDFRHVYKRTYSSKSILWLIFFNSEKKIEIVDKMLGLYVVCLSDSSLSKYCSLLSQNYGRFVLKIISSFLGCLSFSCLISMWLSVMCLWILNAKGRTLRQLCVILHTGHRPILAKSA